MAAGDLKNGDEVYLIDEDTAVVIGAELEKLDEPIKVYNLEVADYNTFFVGDEAVLVHNYEKGEALNDNDLVVRGGQSDPETLIKNQQLELPGRGSMSANGGSELLDILAGFGNTGSGFPQGKIGYTTAGDIRGLGDGWDVIHDPTTNNPYHIAILPPNGEPLTGGLASLLSALFQVNLTPNIYKN